MQGPLNQGREFCLFLESNGRPSEVFSEGRGGMTRFAFGNYQSGCRWTTDVRGSGVLSGRVLDTGECCRHPSNK